MAAYDFSATWAIGLMTGTALDGEVDVGFLRTNGETIIERGPFFSFGYSGHDRQLFADAIEAALAWDFYGPRPDIIGTAESRLTQIYADAVLAALVHHNIEKSDVGVLGGHGLTVLHRPHPAPQAATLQILDGQRLSDLTQITAVVDFRSNDVAAKGHGAPLAPIYHQAMGAFAKLATPFLVVNLGGVANATLVGAGLETGENDIFAFDTGPANGPLNSWVEAHGKGHFDKDGLLSLAGKVDNAKVAEILAKPWFDLPFPKSLDRYDFTADMVEGFSLEDGAATLCAISAAALATGLTQFPDQPKEIILCGGGRKNPAMVQEIKARCGAIILDADDIGLNGDSVEADCFAFLAVRSMRGLPLSFPNTTGVSAPTLGGRCFLPTI